MFFKNRKIKNKIPLKAIKDESGVSILLAILILSSLTVLIIVVSDVVLRVAKSSRQIGYSEVAYYAAETSVEKALYYIEKSNPRTLEIPDGGSGSLSDITTANWTRSIGTIASLATDCDDLADQEGICVDNPGEITSSNPLKVQLNSNDSFQLELDFVGLSLPNNLQISWSGNAKVISYSGVVGQNSSITSPVNLSDLTTNLYIIRLINLDSSLITFQIKPSSGSSLPIGIRVTGTGNYKGEQRVLEVERTNWQIY